MPVPNPLYQEVYRKLTSVGKKSGVRKTSLKRLALLSVGIVAANSCVIQKVSTHLFALHLTGAEKPESVARRMRRTVDDPRLDSRTCYEPLLAEIIDWQVVLRGNRTVVLVVDESSKEDEIHYLRVGLCYWGGVLHLAQEVWEQNCAQPEGEYWKTVDDVLARVQKMLPEGLTVVVTADRAYDVPAFVDRISSRGWHWVIRLKLNSDLCFRDRKGDEHKVRTLVREHVSKPGQIWKGRGRAFKNAGWRRTNLVATWEKGESEPLAVLTDLRGRSQAIKLYNKRFWVEAGFRNDKTHGWQWESSQVKGVEHHRRLLLAMAWASLVVLCLGVQEAKERAESKRREVSSGKARGKPEHARESVFAMGLRRALQWLYGTAEMVIHWLLPLYQSTTWNDTWLRVQDPSSAYKTVRP
jgi:hypothetical protein